MVARAPSVSAHLPVARRRKLIQTPVAFSSHPALLRIVALLRHNTRLIRAAVSRGGCGALLLGLEGLIGGGWEWESWEYL